jgi:hypothetical protein
MGVPFMTLRNGSGNHGGHQLHAPLVRLRFLQNGNIYIHSMFTRPWMAK